MNGIVMNSNRDINMVKKEIIRSLEIMLYEVITLFPQKFVLFISL